MQWYRQLLQPVGTHKSVALDLIRIFLGVALFIRGWLFINDQESLMTLIRQSGMDWLVPAMLVHYITLAHLVGGLMLAAGLFTRWAALLQIPILIGAVFFVHLNEGLWASGQSLELAALVLFLLVVVLVYGSGQLSMDYYLQSRGGTEEEQEARAVTATPPTAGSVRGPVAPAERRTRPPVSAP